MSEWISIGAGTIRADCISAGTISAVDISMVSEDSRPVELKPLICPRCGGSIDRATLKCKYCETEFIFSNSNDVYGWSKNICYRDANGLLRHRKGDM